MEGDDKTAVSTRQRMVASRNNKQGNEPATDNGRVYLKKEVGLVKGVAIIMGFIIGSGIFMAPQGILRGTYSVGMSLVVWVICGIMSSVSALCYAELGSTIHKSGGTYTYILQAYGDLPGFLVSWANVLVINPSGSALNALTFGTYVSEYVTPGECLPLSVVTKLFSILAMMLCVFINCMSVRHSASAQVAFTTSKVLILVIIIGCGIVKMIQGETRHLDPTVSFEGTSADVFGYGTALYQGLWAFAGWDVLNLLTEEVKNSKRNIPLAICISMTSVLVIYLFTNIAYFTLLSADEVLASNAVAVTFAERVLGPMAWIVPLGVCISTFGNLLSGLLAMPRNAYVAGREGHMVKALSMVSVTRHTPLPSIVFQGTIATIMVSIGDFNSVLNYFSFAAWLFFGFGFLAIPVLRYRFPDHHRPFKVPIVLPIAAAIFCLFMVLAPIISEPTLAYLYLVAILMGIGVIFYVLFVWKKYRPGFMDAVSMFIQKMFLVAPSSYLEPDEN
ncbi:b(0,+)-type amino acid transporter 1-like isoform X2 [Patiria miniata]|nr:b(0,+)-type amino acid transporter 1-like isoform X2 [Patiria miniata]XP_038053065.1 b(0,+)-type amino acid transporter 1-like isoform X2 [Patiria miniata]